MNRPQSSPLHRVALTVAAAGAVAALVVAAGDPAAPERAPAGFDPATASAPTAVAPAGPAAAPDVAADEVTQRRYRLTYDRLVSLGAGQVRLELAGTWTVVPIAAERVQVQLAVDAFDAPEAAPLGLELPFQLGFTDGRLSGIGHHADVAPAARNLLAELATALQPTAGEGDAWSAEEVDLNGPYHARYQRTADGSVRVRAEYVGRDAITASGETRFRFDDAGLLAVRVDEMTERAFGGLDARASAAVQARLDRRSARAVPRPKVALLPLRPIAPVADPAGLRAADQNRIGDADMDTVRGWLDALARTDLQGDARSRLRDGVHAKLRTFARLHPEALGEYLALLRTASPEQARLMTAALGGAGTPEATAALTGLLGADLSPGTERAAHFALNATRAPSADSARALLARIDDPEHGQTALLAAANQARTLDGSAPEVTDDIVDVLLERYTDAPDRDTRGLIVGALGNTGDPRILPALSHALQLGDRTLARVAALAYRHVPTAEADVALAALLRGHPAESVRIEAVGAIALRDQNLWRPRLEAWLPELAEHAHLSAAIRRVMLRWDGPPVAMAANP